LKGNAEIKCSQKSTLEILKVMYLNIKVTDNLSGGSIPVDDLPSSIIYM